MGELLFFFLVLLLIVCLFIIRRKKSSDRSYDQGKFGEYLIWKELRGFTKRGGKVLCNLYIPKPHNKTTEIDLVLIHPKGFFVIESKNYSGWIFGHERNQYWTQTLPVGRGYTSYKNQFYNPLRQNSSHIKYLKRVLRGSIPMWSLIVFSDKCTLKDVTVSAGTRYKVIQLYELHSLVSQIIKDTNKDLFSESGIQWMYNRLYPFTQVDEEIKKRHIM